MKMNYLKNSILKFILAMTLILMLSGCSTRQTVNIQETPVIDLSDNGIDLGHTEERLKTGEDIIVRIPKGHSLPVYLNIKSPIAHMDSKESRLVFDQELYLYINKKEIKASPDGVSWVEFSKMKDLKKLFGIREGSVNAGFHIKKESEPAITVSLILVPVE